MFVLVRSRLTAPWSPPRGSDSCSPDVVSSIGSHVLPLGQIYCFRWWYQFALRLVFCRVVLDGHWLSFILFCASQCVLCITNTARYNFVQIMEYEDVWKASSRCVCHVIWSISHLRLLRGIRMVSNARRCVCGTAGSILPASWSEAAWNRCATLEGIRLAVLFFKPI